MHWAKMEGRRSEGTMDLALPPVLAVMKCSNPLSLLLKQEGQFYSVSALQFISLGHYKNYIFQFYMKNWKKQCMIQLSTPTLNLIQILSWCDLGTIQSIFIYGFIIYYKVFFLMYLKIFQYIFLKLTIINHCTVPSCLLVCY